MSTEFTWEPAIESSRWFTRGWTLQELLAPSIVEFFSREWEELGDKTSLKLLISKTTSISLEALDGAPLSQFSVSERLRWKEARVTKHEEDGAYSLQGNLDVELAPVYGEDPRNYKKRIEETNGGLLADSYRWVLDDTTFQQWQLDPHNRLLWVKGDPGKGKTMLLCGIINEVQKTVANTVSVSYFFCQATDSRINSATDSFPFSSIQRYLTGVMVCLLRI
ncbi:hypothetical protein LTR49_027947 [Elasticomyces elasticus]|nr:hypothetical protein LTR49_027947 [Elasticomyces elasticus]